MKIEIRSGDDWSELLVDGERFCGGHSIPTSEWVLLLSERLGVEVSTPEGDFCVWCSGWTTEKLVESNNCDDKICPTCKAEEEAEETP